MSCARHPAWRNPTQTFLFARHIKKITTYVCGLERTMNTRHVGKEAMKLSELEPGQKYSLVADLPHGVATVLFSGIVAETAEQTDHLIDDFLAIGVIKYWLDRGIEPYLYLEKESDFQMASKVT